ncbi:hypothetical protein [Rubrolithibacter danxiaensis]|uniref:hypothetical protein n=1 Tax=Rubrolithibacter danxiaensis TaxID=3390805 RepID=UPI003BF82CF4
MQENQHYAFQIQLSKEFLIWTHSHRLIDNVSLDGDSWEDLEPFNFAGRFGTQFTSVDQIQNFHKAFNNLLARKSIDYKHKPSLLYFILFFDQDTEQQSIERNNSNRMKDYANFLSDLYIQGINDIKRMSKKNDYTAVHDPYTKELFFAKNHLVDSMEMEDLIVYVPDKKHSDDIVKYLRITIGKHEAYVPKEMRLSLLSSTVIKNTLGETIQTLDFPFSIHYQLLKYTVNTMMKELKKGDEEFYNLFQDEEISVEEELRKRYKPYKKHKISNVRPLSKLGIVITDYISENRVLKTKTDIADFLWEYFALFKAYELPKVSVLPTSYSELRNFYIQNGITKESVRLIMKNAHIIFPLENH